MSYSHTCSHWYMDPKGIYPYHGLTPRSAIDFHFALKLDALIARREKEAYKRRSSERILKDLETCNYFLSIRPNSLAWSWAYHALLAEWAHYWGDNQLAVTSHIKACDIRRRLKNEK